MGTETIPSLITLRLKATFGPLIDSQSCNNLCDRLKLKKLDNPITY